MDKVYDVMVYFNGRVLFFKSKYWILIDLKVGFKKFFVENIFNFFVN